MRKVVIVCLATASIAAVLSGGNASAAPADCAAKPKANVDAYWYTMYRIGGEAGADAEAFKRDKSAEPIPKGTCLPATTKHYEGRYSAVEPRKSDFFVRDFYGFEKTAWPAGSYEYFYEVPGKTDDETRYYRDNEISWQ